MSLNIVFSYLFSSMFLKAGWMAHGGLALANSLATAIEAVVLWWVMRKRVQGLPVQHVIRGVLQAGFCAAVMGVFLWIWLQFSQALPAWQVTLLGILIGSGVFLLAAVWLKIPELRSLGYAILRRMKVRA
jgi:putative peptidoglycan lipid II flippase